MSDYQLTSGQQTSLINFLNDGKGIYVGGNDFGYFQKNTNFYKMFGCTYVGDGSYINNVQNLTGQTGTLMEGAQINYTYGSAYPDQYVDYISSNGGDILFKCQKNYGRAVAYAGSDGSYRAIHSTFWFGAMKDSGATCNKAKIMAAYMRYLSGDSMVVAVENEISVSSGGQANLMLEGGASMAGRSYGVLGSLSGTTPGFDYGSVHIPLNVDAAFNQIHNNWNSSNLVDFQSTLDASGRGSALLDTPASVLNPGLAGQTLHLAWVTMSPVNFASNATGVQFVP